MFKLGMITKHQDQPNYLYPTTVRKDIVNKRCLVAKH